MVPERKPVVLVIDDDPGMREELRKNLGVLDPRVLVVEAGDVGEAIAVASHYTRHSPAPLDIAIIDMHMPQNKNQARVSVEAGMDVAEICLSLSFLNCPIMFFTAYPLYRDCVRAVKAGAYAYIPKLRGEKEGGMEDLMRQCETLLQFGPYSERKEFPSEEWMRQHGNWLSSEFTGKWLAFVERATAEKAGLNGLPTRGEVSVVSGKSFDEVRNTLVEHPRVFARVEDTGQAGHRRVSLIQWIPDCERIPTQGMGGNEQ